MKKRRLILILLALCVFVKIPMDSFFGAYRSTFGTNKALGSPLLNDNFEVNDWNPWEMVCFGVFLSNYCSPFYDDYESAFSKASSKGSKGKGLSALVFGTGSDSATQKALEPMLKYCIDAQKQGARPLYTSVTKVTRDGITEIPVESPEARLKDIFRTWNDTKSVPEKFTTDNRNELQLYLKDELGVLSGSDSGQYGKSIFVDNKGDGVVLPYAAEFSTTRLEVVGSAGQKETVFNTADSWDMGMELSAIANMYYNGMYKENSEFWDKMMESNPPLVLDLFGNICAKYDGRNIIIIPASCNQYITKSKKYNLINSVALSELYGRASGKDIVEYMQVDAPPIVDGDYDNAGRGPFSAKATGSIRTSKDATIEGGEGKVKTGDAFIYFDSLDYMYPKINTYNSDTMFSGLGTSIVKLMDSNIDSTTGTQLPLKLGISSLYQVTGGSGAVGSDMTDINDVISEMAMYYAIINRYYPTRTNIPIVSKLWTPNAEISVFGEPVYITAGSILEDGDTYAIRNTVNESLRYISGKKSANSAQVGLLAPVDYRGKLGQVDTITDLARFLFFEGENASALFKNSLLTNVYNQPKNTSLLSTFNKKPEEFVNADNWTMTNGKEQELDLTTIKEGVSRVFKVYPKSETMVQAINALHVAEGTEFGVWTPYVYVTYLQTYGLLAGSQEFNENIFSNTSDVLNTKGEDLFDNVYQTEEEKKQSVLNMTYMLLDTDSNKSTEYRTEWMNDALSGIMYKWYNGIVYGTSSTNTYAEYTTRSSAGFLKIDSYSDNFLTSLFLEYYSQYVLILLGLFILIIFVAGIITKKAWVWFLMSFLTVVNLLLATPMLGDITPYVSNKVVENIFSPKLTYWAMAENISNAQMEAKFNSNNSGKETDLSVSSLVKMLNIVYLDRSLMLKMDMSKKVIEDSTEVIGELQNLTTTRWLMPILMRQFTANDGNADYVYQSLGDLFDNMSSLYWYYVPSDKVTINTIKAKTVQNGVEDDYDADVLRNAKHTFYSGYTPTADDTNKKPADTYYCINRNTDGAYQDGLVKSDENNVHTGFYLLDFDELINDTVTIPKYTPDVVMTDTEKTNIKNAEVKMEGLASSYNSSEGIHQSYGYLWMTESVMPYMYTNIKDTFGSKLSLSRLVTELQGSIEEGYYKKNEDNSIDYNNKAEEGTIPDDTYEFISNRMTFMHSGKTGNIRDFCDMRELFTNAIPYIYSVTCLTGGEDGDTGIFDGAKMNNYKLYQENNKSWFLRSNWVLKLMENSDLTREDTVYDANGTAYKVSNPIDPSTYPAERPMIFSEAEMIEKGLTNKDMSLVELKIQDMYKNIEQRWTLLLNYVNSDGVSPEILYRQMALEAMFEFNKEFSVNRIINSSMAMYPNTIDLRNVSFDSVMKLLLLNSTRNAGYVYGDSISTLLSNSDLGTSFLMLLIAFLCVGVIPVTRNILLGIMFYLSFWSLITNIISEGGTKFKITAGYLIGTLIFLAINLVYYGLFGLLINFNSADEVLSLNNFVVDSGAPIGQFIIILIADIAYLIISFLLGKFIVLNRRDMGFQRYAMWAGNAFSKVSGVFKGAIGGLGSRLTGSREKIDRSKSGIGNTKGYDSISKDKDIRRDKIEVTANIDKGANRNTQSKKPDKDIQYNSIDSYYMDIQNEIKEDVNASERIREKVRRGEDRVNKTQTDKQSSQLDNGQRPENK